MKFGRGVPIVSVLLIQGMNSKIFNIGDTVSNVVLYNDATYTGTLVGIELDSREITGDKPGYMSYDNIPTDGYINPICSKVPNIDASHEVVRILLKCNEAYVPILIEEIKSVELISQNDQEWIDATKSNVETAVQEIQSEHITAIALSGMELTIIIDDPSGVDQALMNMLTSIPDVTKIQYQYNDQIYTMIPGNEETYAEFEQGLKDSIPTQSNQTTKGVIIMSNENNTQLVYTLKVNYYNEADNVAKIGDVGYTSLEKALAAAVSGDTVVLLKNITAVNTAASAANTNPVYTIPAGVTLDGQNCIITADVDNWVGTNANHIIGISSGNVAVKNLTIEGHEKAKSGIVCFGSGTVVAIENVTVHNCGNCGVQVAGANVTATGLITAGNAWGAVNVDKGSDGSTPAFTIGEGCAFAENVEVYTEITDQDVITASGMTKYQGYGETLKGFIFYTTDVNRLGIATSEVTGGVTKVFETLSDASVITDGSAVTLLTDVTEDVVFAETANLELDLAGHNITGIAGDAITNNGTLKVSNNGVIDAVAHGKAAVMNNGVCDLEGGHYTRSAEAGTAAGNGGNSYYTILNHGVMTLGPTVEVDNSGLFSSCISSGWYDSTGKNAEDDTCELTIAGAQISGGKYALKNDELGVMTINSGVITNNGSESVVLNWHKLTMTGGQIASSTVPAIANGIYGLGIGQVIVTDGVFDCPTTKPAFVTVSGYASENYQVSGGTYKAINAVPEAYLVENYTMVDVGDGTFKVQQKTASEIAKEEIDAVIDTIESETTTVTPDPEADGTYIVNTSTGSLSETGLLDSVAAIENVSQIAVANESGESASYTAGGDLEAFKTAVDALMPNNNDAGTVTLTMTVTIAE